MADCREEGALEKEEDSDEVEGTCNAEHSVKISYEAEHCEKQENNVKVDPEWCDITERFQRSCQVLALGELMHDPYFCLGEAMAAVEFMEARMDLNMHGASSFPPLLTAHEALETAPARPSRQCSGLLSRARRWVLEPA